ncbi:adenylyl-sulfate kinase [Paenibacillus spongiae]|uniref:Adenylyl-sulfate kinase n=1 Tax=Paenibacillus spongiae TaxID=2909671 RepID=A0ABY5SJ42_9BACL|nr:adenylyl-sulfate kinase [Paenibacillus spongiae]UVI33769.1 adenylyl-sulfate kinase [Paenibacillus spongiae]
MKCSEECEKRDPKGLYKKARNGQISNFTESTANTTSPAARICSSIRST